MMGTEYTVVSWWYDPVAQIEKLKRQLDGWAHLVRVVSGRPAQRIRAWVRRAVAPLVAQRSAPRWGMGRWRAKT